MGGAARGGAGTPRRLLELRSAVVAEAERRRLLADRVVDLLIERIGGAAALLELLFYESVALCRQVRDALPQLLAPRRDGGHGFLARVGRKRRDGRGQRRGL